MLGTDYDIFQQHRRSNWVRLRTLVVLRWCAIAGQILATAIATQVYGLRIEIFAVVLVIGSSVLVNLFSSFRYPENKRLSEREAAIMLVFDILQLSVLLFLTGGLNNPFALLLLAPVTIASTVLHFRSMIVVGLLTVFLVTLLSRTWIPILNSDGSILLLPPLFQFGFWVSLMVGVVFLAGYARQVTTEMNAMGEALVATQMALSREQKLTDLGRVVAAAAHELGTPLATIKLVSSELMEELADRPDLAEDAALLRQQAERCRDILQSMGRAGKDDLHLRSAPLEAVVREAAEPHLDRGKTVEIYAAPELEDGAAQPLIARGPEIVHGLRNLIQNAVDFAESDVSIEAMWSDHDIKVRIADDGHGFPQSVIGRIGDPFVRRRRVTIDGAQRPGYDGMGLGLFIAKTLLERSGARLSFANGRRHGHAGWAGQATGGAIVTVTWPHETLTAPVANLNEGLGPNRPITA